MNEIARKCSSILKITLFVLLFLQNISPALAGDATLTWNAPTTNSDGSPLADLAGYKVYYGTSSSNYGTSLDVGNQLTYTVTGLGTGTYYFAVTAYDTSGNESGFSNEGSKTFADTTPPVILAIIAGNITSSGASIAWTTDEPSDTQVQYGTTTAYGSSTALNTTMVTSHSQSLTGLQASTLYHYSVLSRDAAANLATSGDNTFTTSAAPDTTPPVISGIAASNITSSGAGISWTTNESSDTQVQYGTTTAYGSSTALNTTMVTSHSQSLTGLQASTLYHYSVLSRDAAANLATSGDSTFTTSPAPDITPPVISGIIASNITIGGATITWSTNEAASSQVEYGTTTSYGSSTTLNSTLVTSHSVALTGLAASTTYHYRVKSADAAANLATSSDNTFTTSAAPDTTPPIISGITASNISSGGATITWSTNEAASSQVEYGTTTSYGSSTTLNSTLVTSHSVALTGLAASTTYHYRVKSADAAANLATSSDNTFTTSAAPDTTPPVLSLITASNISSSSVAITWGTNEPSTTQVEYGLTTAYGNSTTLNATLSNSHNQSISGLTALTVYHYRVKSTDAAANLATSGDNTFTTSAVPDTTPPGNAQNFTAQAGNQQITLSWTNPPDSDFVGVRIRYRTDRYPSDINDGTLLGDFTGQPNQAMSTIQTSVQNGVTYYYSASSYDSSGNYQETAYASVTVPGSADSSGGSNNVTMSGGCGMVFPSNGKPSGPAQAADMVGLLAIILIAILKRELQKKKSFDRFVRISDIICFTRLPFQQNSKRPISRSHTLQNSATQFLMVKRRCFLTVNAIMLILMCYSGNVFAGDAVLSWNANTDGDLAGYKIYYGTASGSYGAPINVGTQTTYTIAGLGLGTYYFAVTAYDISGNESGFSNEVSKTVSSLDTTPPANVQNFTAKAGDQQITLSWTNPPDSDFIGVRIRYRTDHYPSDINDGVLLGDFTGPPSQAVSSIQTSLQNSVTYYYSASTYDSSGNYQETAYVSATPSVDVADTQKNSIAGGCGMVRPTDGKPSNPAQAADILLLPVFLLLLSVLRRRHYSIIRVFDRQRLSRCLKVSEGLTHG